MITRDSRYCKELIDGMLEESFKKGVYIDLDKAEELYEKEQDRMREYKEGIEELFGGKFEGKAVGASLVSKDEIERILRGFKGEREDVERARQYIKGYRGSYFKIKKLEEISCMVDENSRVHPGFSYGDSNRVTLKRPGLSNIPRDCLGILGEEPGYRLIRADFKAQEVYIQVNVMGIEGLKGILECSDDFYGELAKIMGKRPVEDRDAVKKAWFLFMYGRGKNLCGCEKEVYDKIEGIEEIARFKDEIYRDVFINKNPVRSYFGTEAVFDDRMRKDAGNVNIAFNRVFQTTGADILYFAMERCYKKFKECGLGSDDCRVYFPMYDELVFYAREDVVGDELIRFIKDSMELEVEGWCKLKVKVSV